MELKTRHLGLACLYTLIANSVLMAQVEYPYYDGGIVQDGSVILEGQILGEVIIDEVILSEEPYVSESLVSETLVPDGSALNIDQTAVEEGTPEPAEPMLAEAAPAGPSVNDQLEELNTKIDDAVEKLLKAHNDTSSYDEQVKSIKKQNDTIKKLLAQRDATLNEIEASLAKQNKQASANAKAIEKLSGKVDAAAKASAADDHSAKVDALSRKVDKAVKAMATAKPAEGDGRALQQLKKQVAGQSEKIDELVAGGGEQLEAQAKTLASMSKKLDTVAKAVKGKSANDDSSKQLKALTGKVDAAIQAMDGADEDSAAVAAKLDDVLKALAENAKRVDERSKTQRGGVGNRALAELKNSFADQAKKSSGTEEKLAQVLKLLNDANSGADADEAKQWNKKLERMQAEVNSRDKELDALKKEMAGHAKAEKEKATREKKRLDKALQQVLGKLDHANKRLDGVAAKAKKLKHAHAAEHGDEGDHADHHDGEGSDEHQKERAEGKHAKDGATIQDAPRKRSTKDDDAAKNSATQGAAKSGAKKSTEVADDDMDPLRKRLEEVKRRLKKAKDKK